MSFLYWKLFGENCNTDKCKQTAENTKEKHAIQQSPYKNLLKPKIGGIATALSAVTEIEYLLDFSLIYKLIN